VIGKLGISVQVEIERFNLRVDRIDLRGSHAPGLGGPRRNGKRDKEEQETFHDFLVEEIKPQRVQGYTPRIVILTLSLSKGKDLLSRALRKTGPSLRSG
jgi:hypothetical protein